MTLMLSTMRYSVWLSTSSQTNKPSRSRWNACAELKNSNLYNCWTKSNWGRKERHLTTSTSADSGSKKMRLAYCSKLSGSNPIFLSKIYFTNPTNFPTRTNFTLKWWDKQHNRTFCCRLHRENTLKRHVHWIKQSKRTLLTTMTRCCARLFLRIPRIGTVRVYRGALSTTIGLLVLCSKITSLCTAGWRITGTERTNRLRGATGLTLQWRFHTL